MEDLLGLVFLLNRFSPIIDIEGVVLPSCVGKLSCMLADEPARLRQKGVAGTVNFVSLSSSSMNPNRNENSHSYAAQCSVHMKCVVGEIDKYCAFFQFISRLYL